MTDGVDRVIPDSDDEALGPSTKFGVLVETTAATPDTESLGANASRVQLATVHGNADVSLKGSPSEPLQHRHQYHCTEETGESVNGIVALELKSEKLRVLLHCQVW